MKGGKKRSSGDEADVKLYGEAVGKEDKDGREEVGIDESWFKDALQAGSFQGSEVREDADLGIASLRRERSLV